VSRILFLSQLLPYPPDAGPKLRSYYVLRHLAQQHRVTLLAFTRPGDAPRAIDHLRSFCAFVHTLPMLRSRPRDLAALLGSLLANQSFIIRRDYLSAMAAKITALLQDGQFDCVHADQLWMAQYALLARGLSPGIKLVLDEHNACFQVFQRLAGSAQNPFTRVFWKREASLLRRFEAQACAGFDHVVTVTEEDRAILQPLAAAAAAQPPPFTTIPICIAAGSPPPPPSGVPALLFVGGMHWPPNAEGMRWFARQVWPLVRTACPQAVLNVIGKSPPPELLGLLGVQAPGYVPDLDAYWAQSAVFIVPLLSGGGMRVKILDAWAHGLPVVSTTIGAEGLAYTTGQDILIADQPQAMAAHILALLKDPALAARLGQAGWETLRRRYHWETVYQAWDAIYPA